MYNHTERKKFTKKLLNAVNIKACSVNVKTFVDK